MSDTVMSITELGATLVKEALAYMGDRGQIPFEELSPETKQTFLSLKDTPDFEEKLNMALNLAESRAKLDIAKYAIRHLEEFNIVSNPELVDAIQDYVIATTPDEIIGYAIDGDELELIVADNSMDRALRMTNKLKTALSGEFENAGISRDDAYPSSLERSAAASLRANIQLHMRPGGAS